MNLIAQGPAITPQDAQDLAHLTASRAETVAHRAFRFRGVSKSDAISSWCEARQIDCAWVPEGRHFKDLKLLAMDMDSTLITIECIDELGDMAGRKAEIAAITAQAMRGEIDYPESLRRRVALLKGLQASALDRVYSERLQLTAGAEQLVSACRQGGVRLLLVSGGFAFFTERLKSRLGLDYTISNSLSIENGLLTGRLAGEIVDAGAKAEKFLSVMKELGATREQTVAIGDGANDLKMMAQAGLSIAYRAKPAVRAQASCALDFSGLDGVLNLFEQVPGRAA
jgi:phosphoserine phosphatase